MDDQTYDPFEEDQTPTEAQVDEGAEQAADKADEESDAESNEDQSGENTSSEPPSEDKTDEKDDSSKMIPEHRFKAALKQVSDELHATKQQLAQATATPAPSRDEDPEGYEFHVRMETSKSVMRATVDDYDEVVNHYVEMAKVNPYLNQAVASHPVPAKYAYDVAKKDIELANLSKLTTSDEWKQFQDFKKKQSEAPVTDPVLDAVSSQLSEGAGKTNSAGKVPNLNRAANIAKPSSISEADDELFRGAL